MALSVFAVGTAAYASSSSKTTTLPTHAAGDLLLMVIGSKPDTASITTTTTGWVLAGSVVGGSGSAAADTGPTRTSVFYRLASSSSEVAPAFSSTATNISYAQGFTIRSSGSSGFSVTAAGGADTTATTDWNVTCASDPGLTVGDFILAANTIPTDAVTPSQFSAETVSGPGLTTITLTEQSEPDSSLGNDIGGWIGTGLVSAGTSTGAPTINATSTTGTNAVGTGLLVRVRETGSLPVKVTGLSLLWADGTTDEARIAWTPVADATSYKVYRNGTALYAGIGTGATNGFTMTGQTVDNANYTVSAVNATGEGPQSDPLFIDYTAVTAKAGTDTLTAVIDDQGPAPTKTTIEPNAKLETLTDDFTTQDTVKWDGYSSTTYVDLGSGELVLDGSSGAYQYLSARDRFDVLGSYFGVEVVEWAKTTTSGSAETIIKFVVDDQNTAEMIVVSGGGYVARMRENGTGNETYPGQIAGMTHLRVGTLEDRTIVWEVYDGNTWTTVRSVPAPASWDLSSTYGMVQSGFWDPADTNYTPARIGSVNIYSEPTVEKSGSDDISATIVDDAATSITGSFDTVVVVTEPAISNITKAGSDTLTPVIAEGKGSYPGETGSDLVKTDVAAETIVKSGSDTLTALVTEGDITYPGNVYPGEDTFPGGSGATVVKTDSITSIVKSASDTLTATIVETASTNSAGLASDVLAPTLVETSSLVQSGLFTKSSSDALTPSITAVTSRQAGIAASDTLTPSLAEQRAFGTVSVAASDTLSPAITEPVSALVTDTPFVEKVATDTLGPTFTESTSFATVSVSANDTVRATVADVSALNTAGLANDLLSPTIVEQSTLVKSGLFLKTAEETFSPTITEQVGLQIGKSASDGLTVSITDDSNPLLVSGGQDKVGPDTLTASITETTSIAISLSRADILAPTLTEARAFGVVAVTSSDTLSATVGEQRSFGTVQVSSSDTVAPSIAEVSTAAVAGIGSDLVSPSITESTEVIKSGVTVESASDTLAPSVTESSVRQPYLSRTDALVPVLTESTSTFVTLQSSDTLSASVIDSAGIFTARTANDTILPVVTDLGSLTIEVPAPVIEKTAADGLSPNFTEGAVAGEKGEKTVRVWTGTTWVTGIVKVGTGTEWHVPTIKVWNGVTWI